MRLYAILVYIVLFSLVLGFINVAINEPIDEDGNTIFLPEAKGIITFETTGTFSNELSNLTKACQELQNSTNILQGMLSLVNVVWTGGMTALAFLFSIFSTVPNLIDKIAELCGIDLHPTFIYILTAGLVILTIYSAFQIFTGKWFSFVE